MAIKLTGEQHRVIELPFSNPIQIKGAAGSGKTTVAVYRALHLYESHRDLFDGNSVCVFSYAKSLIGFIKGMVEEHEVEPGKVVVTTFHSWAYQYLDSQDYWKGRKVVNAWDVPNMLTSIRDLLRQGHVERAILKKDVDFYKDEVTWIKGRAIASEEEYYNTPRTGRGTADRVTQEDRRLLWTLFEAYQERLAEQGLVDFDDYALATLKLMRTKPDSKPSYTHIVVDEAQDLTKAQLSVISQLAEQPRNSITLVADAAQKIYKSGFSWREVGLEVRGGRTIELLRNYRNTRQIAAAALTMVNQHSQSFEYTTAQLPDRLGPKPSVVAVKKRALYEAILHNLRSLPDKVTAAVLCRHRKDADLLYNRLEADGVACARVNDSKPKPGSQVAVATMHSAKGLEFDRVFLYDVSDGEVPTLSDEEDQDESLQYECRLLYTAMTRARQHLTMYVTGKESRFLESLGELVEREALQ